MKGFDSCYTEDDFDEFDERGLPRLFTYCSEKINEIIHVVNDAELHPALDFDDVLLQFRKNNKQQIDRFCEHYLKENYIKKEYDADQFINTVHQLRRFLFNLESEGKLRV